MKKSFLPVLAVFLTVAFIVLRSNRTINPMSSDLDRSKNEIAETQTDGLAPQSSIETKDRDFVSGGLASSHHEGVLSHNQDSSSVSPEAMEQQRVSQSAVIASGGSLMPLAESGPSIGAVKVIGNRGCDANTQGWYLGKGKPDEYDFTESDDGETLAVHRNVQNLTGAFEFVHCVDANQIAGKHIQFRVKLKAQDVQDIAQLRFWGENPSRERILFKSEKVVGTYDWKEFAIEADVPSEVTLFNYGITFRNSGKLWISRPVFSVSR